MTKHRFRLLSSDGNPLAVVENLTTVEYVRVLNDVGWFTAVSSPDFRREWLDVDRLVEVWRQPEGGEERLEVVAFMRYWEWSMDPEGREFLRFGGPDQIELLNRRIVAYVSGDPGAEKTLYADDMLKQVVRENAGDLAPVDEAGRERKYPSANFSTQAYFGDAPEITRSFAWRQMLDILQEIADASWNLGTPLYFDCIPTGRAKFDFRTFTNVYGIDRTLRGGLQPIVFSLEAGNMANPSLREDWSDEWNYVYGGGQGEGASRIIDPEKDVHRNFRSIWNRRETFQDAREETTQLGVAGRSYEKLQASRPRLIFGADLLDSPNARYGVDWSFGDRVSAQYKGRTFEGIVRQVHVTLDADGTEALDARLEVTLATG